MYLLSLNFSLTIETIVSRSEIDEVSAARVTSRKNKEKNKTKTEISKAAKSIATSAGRTAANYMVRGLLGSLLKK